MNAMEQAIQSVDRLTDRLKERSFSDGAITAGRTRMLELLSRQLPFFDVSDVDRIVEAAAKRFDFNMGRQIQ